MNPALRRYWGSFKRSMRSFVPGLTSHAQVGAIMSFFCCLYKQNEHFLYVISALLSVWLLFSERFWLVPASGQAALLSGFLERFQSTCLLAQQLPAMKPEQLKLMVRHLASVIHIVSRLRKAIWNNKHCSITVGLVVYHCCPPFFPSVTYRRCC